MRRKQREAGLPPALWTFILFGFIIGAVVLTIAAFNRDLRPYARVTLTSDRAGLVMEPGAKVKLRGVQVGRVSALQPGDPVKLQLEIYPDQLRYIPANIGAEITATTAFGAKYVDLLTPTNPSPKRLAAGAVVASNSVSIETNTVFQNLVAVLNQVDVPKLNAVLTAVADGFRGKGQLIGEATTDLNQVLAAVNPRSETIRADFGALKGFSDTYSAAAHNIVTILDSVSTTSTTITDNAKQLDALLLNVSGLSRAGINVIGPNKDNLVHGVNLLETTTRLLMKYNPELTCTLVGGKNVLDDFLPVAGGRNGYSVILDVALLLGDDTYRFPDNLPINGAKGGPGGQPGCGSLPDVYKNFPQRYLVTNTGWGGGMDMRPNPGIGFPGYVDYFPVTRGIPQPPSVRHPGGPAPGPVPGTAGYPGPAPYGAPQYAPDGTPLYPGLPPAPPPGRPRDPGPPPAGPDRPA